MMNYRIKPIKNEKDYNAALEYFETIIDAKEKSAEADLREVMSILIEKYEEEKYPIDLPTPVDAIRFRMEQMNLNQSDLIPFIGSKAKASEILSGKRELTLKMVRALHKHLGIPAEILLKSSEKELPELIEGIEFEKFPITEMQKNGAFKNFYKDNIKDNAEEAIRFLITKIGGWENLPLAQEGLYRKNDSMRLNAKLNKYSLLGWSLQVLAKARTRKIKTKYDKKNINDTFLNGLICLSSLNEGPKLAVEYLANHGIILEIIPHLKRTYIDGAVFITKAYQPIIGLTIRYDRVDNFWFVLLHEIGHLKKHFEEGKYFADDMSLRGSMDDSDLEIQADKFAENTLLPTDFNLHEKTNITNSEIIEYAKKNSIHPAIITGRIQYKRNNYRIHSNLIGRGEVKKCFKEIFK